MSTTTPLQTLPDPAAAYLAAVSDALADLPDGEREDLLEEVAGHLGDVADELGTGLDSTSLQLRLGSPQTYATELRAAAGYDAAPVDRVRRVTRLRGRASRLQATVASLPGTEGLRRLAVELRPGWWVLRAWLLLSWISLSDPSQRVGVVPHVVNNALVNLVLLVLAIFGSVRLGRRVTQTTRSRNWRRAAIALNVLVIVGLIPVYSGIQDRTAWSNGSISAAAPTAPPGFGSGGEATNLFAFAPDGTLIPEFYLYDENGQPVDLGDDTGCADPSGTSTLPFDNHYPREQYTQKTDQYGNDVADCVPAGRAPGFSVAIPSAAPSASPTP